MNLNHLEYAVAVAKYGSISKASQQLFMSQPYLSGMMKGLEEELGYKIFTRTSLGISLTREGEQFINSAKLILLELKKIREINADDTERPLNISCYYTSFIMERFLRFQESSPCKLPDKIKEMGTKEVLESVLAGNSTLGIIFYAHGKKEKYEKITQELGIRLKELFPSMQVYALMSRKHPLAEKPGIYMADLEASPYVTYDDLGSKDYLKYLGIENHPRLLAVSDRGSFYDALQSGRYLSVMAFQKPPKEHMHLMVVPILDRKLLMHGGYCIAKNYKMTKREKEFLAFLQF